MKTAVELFTSLTGWAAGLGSTLSAYALNVIPDYVADHLAASVVFKIPAGNLGKSITKTIAPAIDVSGCSELVLSVWSRKKQAAEFMQLVDFAYSIAFSAGKTLLLPTFNSFGDVTFSLAGITSIDRVTITALHNDEDYLVLSACYGITDEYPLDILTGVKAEIDRQALALYPDGLLLPVTASGAVGATRAVFTGNLDFIDRYSLLKLKSATHTETHLVEQFDEQGATFKSSWDGAALLYAHTVSAVYLQFPCFITLGETDLVAPGIALQCMAPEPVNRSSGTERLYDTFDAAGPVSERQEELTLRYVVLVDCESMHYETLARINRIVRAWLGTYAVWINGRRHDVLFEEPAVEMDPTVPNETLPKTQYSVGIEVKEARGARVALPRESVYNRLYHPVSPGGTVP